MTLRYSQYSDPFNTRTKKSHAKYLVNARNEQTGMYLHMSGMGETKNKEYAWVGTKEQYKKMPKPPGKIYLLVTSNRVDEDPDSDEALLRKLANDHVGVEPDSDAIEDDPA